MSTVDELERRLREAQAQNEQFEAENEERERLRELEKQVRFEENKVRDLPHIQAAEDEHGVIGVVNTPNGAVVLRRPHHLAFNQFVRRMGNEKKPPDNHDFWKLVKPCIVYPDAATVNAWTDEFAGLTIKLGSKVIELGNGEVEELEGK